MERNQAGRMAVAKSSTFTKVSVLSSWTVPEAEALMSLLDIHTVAALTTKEQILVSGIAQALREALSHGRN